jgi:hypothetical protein
LWQSFGMWNFGRQIFGMLKWHFFTGAHTGAQTGSQGVAQAFL